MEPQRLDDELHPGRLEIESYLRGRLAIGHAAAILAHLACCSDCGRRVARAAAVRPATLPPRPTLKTGAGA